MLGSLRLRLARASSNGFSMSSGLTIVRITPAQIDRWRDRALRTGDAPQLLLVRIDQLAATPTLANLEHLIKTTVLAVRSSRSPGDLQALLVEAYQTAREAR